MGLELKPVCDCQKNIAAFKHFRRVLLLPYNFIRHILNTHVLCWLGVLCASYNLFGLNSLQWLSYGSFCSNSLILVATEGLAECYTKLVLVQPMWNQLDGENDEMSIWGLPHSFCLCHLTLLSFTFPDGFTLLYCADIIRAPSDYRILHLVLDIIIFPQLTNDCESNFGKISN